MTAQIISFNTPQPKPVKEPECSFCGTPKAKCAALFAGTDDKHHICNVCVRRAAKRAESVEV